MKMKRIQTNLNLKIIKETCINVFKDKEKPTNHTGSILFRLFKILYAYKSGVGRTLPTKPVLERERGRASPVSGDGNCL